MPILKPNKDKPKKEKISRQEKARIRKEEKQRQKIEEKHNNLLKKEAQIREQQRIEDEGKPIIWNYAGEADITIGETKVSNVAKIILLALIAGLIVLGVFGFLNKNKLVDHITKPHVVLTDKEVNLEVGSNFDYKEYLAEEDYPERYKVYYPKNDSVNTAKVGKYDVKYGLKTSAGINTTDLVVNVVDTTKPTIELKDSLIKLTRGSETKKFNPKKYIKSYSDNYDPKEKLVLTYTEKFDWSKDKVEVNYSVKDSSNNVASKKLLISVSEPVKETQAQSNQSSGGNNNSSSGNSSSGSNNSSNNSSGNNSSGGGSNGGGGGSSSPYISGVHNITVSQGSDFGSMVSKLTSGVHGSGYVSVDYSSVNLTAPGSYTVTFSSSDGVTKYATVTVK